MRTIKQWWDDFRHQYAVLAVAGYQVQHVADAVRIKQLEDQVARMGLAAQACADEITVMLPALEDGDWGLVSLTRKLTNELQDARTELVAIDEALAREPEENRAHRITQLSCKAAVAGAIGDLLHCPVGQGPAVIMETVNKVLYTADYYKDFGKSLKDMMTWLGARKDESLRQAVQRVVLTAEVAPGAAKELQAVRALLDATPGETVVQALKRPVDYVAIVTTNKGVPCGITLGALSEWPPIGDVKLKSREL